MERTAKLRHKLQDVLQALPSAIIGELNKEGQLLLGNLIQQSCIDADASQESVPHNFQLLAWELESLAWQGLHCSTAWQNVTEAVRGAYVYSQLLLARISLINDPEDTMLQGCIRRLDHCLLMGPPVCRSRVQKLVEAFQGNIQQNLGRMLPECSIVSRKKPRYPFHSSSMPTEHKLISTATGIQRLSQPSLCTFLQNHMNSSKPVIVCQGMEAWPALGQLPEYRHRAWSNLRYIKAVAGCRTVPVEVGRGTYLEEGGAWGQRLMTVREFVELYLEGAGEPRSEAAGADAYLAQHELFEQIPLLKRDIIVPEYCALEVDETDLVSSQAGKTPESKDSDGVTHNDGGDDGDHVIINAWFGPAHTVSPTHTDPYHNLLCQVVGSKHIRLFDPCQDGFLYPHEGIMHNNSQVDPKAPDLKKFPLFAQARSLECVLRPGEMLYIPPLWWHHIESRSTSFSVSFWWGRRRRPQPNVESAV